MGQKKLFGLQKFWSKNFGQKIFGQKNFGKKMLVKKFLVKKIFGKKKMLGPKKCLAKKISSPNFCLKKNFGPKRILSTKNFLGPKKFWVNDFFWAPWGIGLSPKKFGYSNPLALMKPTCQILASHYAWNPLKSSWWVVVGG